MIIHSKPQPNDVYTERKYVHIFVICSFFAIRNQGVYFTLSGVYN